LFFVSCQTTEPPIDKTPPETVRDTITVTITDSTHRSITLNVKSTFNKPAKSIELYRRRNNQDSLVEIYTAFTLEKEIIDDDSGKGLALDTEYKYFAVRVDTANKWIDTSEIITARTLPATSHDYIWEEYTLGEWQSSLWDVWGTDENNVYAVGSVTINDTTYGVIHWDGTEWKGSLLRGGLHTIFGFSKNDIWVAGNGFANFDGTTWKEIENDNVINANVEYTSLWGTSSDNLYLGNMWGKIIHWDGERGTKIYSKDDYYINDIKGTSNNNIWVLGSINNLSKSKLLQYNGITWENIDLPTDFPVGSIYCYNEKEVYITNKCVYRLSKRKWVKLGNICSPVWLGYISGKNPNNLFISGYEGMYHYNGIDIRYYAETTGNLIYSIYSTDKKVFTVGYDNNLKPVILIGTKKE
jgi:hypothetical protein